MTAAYYLSEKGQEITLFEKETVLGGLAQGFKAENWDWYLERAIHHLLSNDDDIQKLAEDTDFNGIFFKETKTASLYSLAGNYRIIPVDTPQDFLKFPYLSLPQKIRAGSILALLQLSPFLSFYERQTAEEFLKKTMGEEVWNILWRELFRKKFGKYAGNILAAFIWARIKKRSKKLGYIEGGFQEFINHIENKIKNQKVKIKKNYTVGEVFKKGMEFVVDNEKFDAIVSTLPTSALIKITSNLFPNDYLKRLAGIKYQHAVSLILETRDPFLEETYWLNMCVSDNPIMGLFQHTNFINKKHFGGNHLLYVGNYVDFGDKLVRMNDKEVLNYYLSNLKKINEKWPLEIENYFVFKGPFAQPIFDKDFLKRKPDFVTPVKNFYIANLDMTYPYDRGTNYAVKLGKQVSEFF